MEWKILAIKINGFKDNFQKSYKCINKNTTIRVDTLKNHIKTLISNYNSIVNVFNAYKNELTADHEKDCRKLLKTLNTKLKNISIKWEIEIHVPDELELHAEFNENQIESLDESKPVVNTESDSEIETLDECSHPIIKIKENMAQTLVEFLKLASSLLPEFDGKAENSQSLKDALLLIESLKGAHEVSAISLIKTKLKGHARNLISNELTR